MNTKETTFHACDVPIKEDMKKCVKIVTKASNVTIRAKEQIDIKIDIIV